MCIIIFIASWLQRFLSRTHTYLPIILWFLSDTQCYQNNLYLKLFLMQIRKTQAKKIQMNSASLFEEQST